MTIAQAMAGKLPGISPGVYDLTDFRAIAQLAYDMAGIVLPPGKAMLVYARIAPLVRETGCDTFGNYIDRIRYDEELRNRTVSALTTNHTFFYREAHHFEHFAAVVRPGLLGALAEGQPVRMWSAGCSSGQETWSLVMTLLGEDGIAGRQIAAGNVRVLASDIAPLALIKARTAQYATADLEHLPTALRDNWIKMAEKTGTVGQEAHRMVSFRVLNLLADWPMTHRFDVIFCRNVLIYFDVPTKQWLAERFAEYLAPGGYLYIGHSERVTGPATRTLHAQGPTIYRRSRS